LLEHALRVECAAHRGAVLGGELRLQLAVDLSVAELNAAKRLCELERDRLRLLRAEAHREQRLVQHRGKRAARFLGAVTERGREVLAQAVFAHDLDRIVVEHDVVVGAFARVAARAVEVADAGDAGFAQGLHERRIVQVIPILNTLVGLGDHRAPYCVHVSRVAALMPACGLRHRLPHLRRLLAERLVPVQQLVRLDVEVGFVEAPLGDDLLDGIVDDAVVAEIFARNGVVRTVIRGEVANRPDYGVVLCEWADFLRATQRLANVRFAWSPTTESAQNGVSLDPPAFRVGERIPIVPRDLLFAREIQPVPVRLRALAGPDLGHVERSKSCGLP
jgi:hypothetical protein